MHMYNLYVYTLGCRFQAPQHYLSSVCVQNKCLNMMWTWTCPAQTFRHDGSCGLRFGPTWVALRPYEDKMRNFCLQDERPCVFILIEIWSNWLPFSILVWGIWVLAIPQLFRDTSACMCQRKKKFWFEQFGLIVWCWHNWLNWGVSKEYIRATATQVKWVKSVIVLLDFLLPVCQGHVYVRLWKISSADFLSSFAEICFFWHARRKSSSMES